MSLYCLDNAVNLLYLFCFISMSLGANFIAMRVTVVVCGYFKKYIQREIEAATGYSIYKPLQGWRTVKRKRWVYGEDMPWTDAAKQENIARKGSVELVEPIPESEWKIFKGDRVSDIFTFITSSNNYLTERKVTTLF